MAKKEADAQSQGRGGDVKLQRGHAAKEELRRKLKGEPSAEDNAKAADLLKQKLQSNTPKKNEKKVAKKDGKQEDKVVLKKKLQSKIPKKKNKKETEKNDEAKNSAKSKRKASDISASVERNESDQDEDDMFGDSDDDSDDDPVATIVEDDKEYEELGDEESEADEEAINAAKKKVNEKIKEIERAKLDDYSKNVEDKVKLHEPGWKDRYYTDKCKADDVKNHGGREHLFRSYVQGLCWVMKYYYIGCPSWKWYYPFHYGPFASDLRNIERFQKDCESFDLSEPFKPVEQLLSVLPDDSSHAVPKSARWLMGKDESPIIDFYPTDVPCDPNGKAMPWLWVVLLPFIDEDRLLGALLPTMKKWTSKELLCNSRGMDDGYVFLHKDHPMSKETMFILDSKDEYTKDKFRLSDKDISRISCFFGYLRKPLSHEIYSIDKDSEVPLPATSSKISRASDVFSDPIEPNQAVCFAFMEPTIESHRSVILPGAVLPPSILTDQDRRIRRPRLNRGGDTIANLGGHNKSHKSGYGSMNISSYERDLANRNGRGRQMNQAGTRSWGSMEPTHKRFHGGRGQYSQPPPQQAAPMQRWQAPPPPPPPPAFPPPPPHPSHWQAPPGHQADQFGRGDQLQQTGYNTNAGAYNQQAMRAMSGNDTAQQQQWGGNNTYTNQRNPDPRQQQIRPQQQSQGYLANNQNNPSNQRQSGFAFNQQGQQRHTVQQPRQNQPTQSNSWSNPQRVQQQQQPQTGGRANLTNLRAQLMSTLQKQRKGN
eukprot:CAMPEP_0201658468 /NCGR_PEP_ID=MMETSP0494-20130426/1327_1 /ASSEMBLY_ACC=CAM_ASM_000839 /TAXON_ID=420259 /ORGANISM="Thalassiosira gravida, Strain GMp14c1" /LENGTH=764 /DNA_ID=CAMNT_0048135455 /DNA_START=13 /DNA_END=2307 /DNA_ORIENTATION=-